MPTDTASNETCYRRLMELEALQRVSLHLTSLMSTPDLLRLIAEQVASLMEAQASALYLYDARQDVLRLEVGVGFAGQRQGQTLRPGEGAAGQTLICRRPLLTQENVTEQAPARGKAGNERTLGVLGVPLMGTSEPLGVLTVYGTEGRAFDQNDVSLVELVAGQASVALENARLHAEAQRRASALAALNKAGQAIVSTLNLESVLKVVISEVQELLKAEGVSVLLRDPNKQELVFASVVGPAASLLVETRMPVTEGIAGWVMQQRKSVLIPRVRAIPQFYASIDDKSGLTTSSMVAAPLMFRGTVWGVIEAINKTDGMFDDHDLEMLEALTSSAAIAFENARLYQVEREQLQRLQDSQAKLIQAEKMSALGRLTASMAHEINNPLQAVQTCLSLVREELQESSGSEDMQHDLALAESEVQRVSSIVRRLREFYRPARAGTQPTDVRATLESMLELIGKQLQNSKIVVEQCWQSDLPLVEANADQLKQVFINLALNAADAMPFGGHLRITGEVDHVSGQHVQATGPAVRIEFEDTGEGISPELLLRIFEPFFTTKSGGTGLGLSITYEIVKSLGGEITVSSQPGAGTTFTVFLPQVRIPASKESSG